MVCPESSRVSSIFGRMLVVQMMPIMASANRRTYMGVCKVALQIMAMKMSILPRKARRQMKRNTRKELLRAQAFG